MDAEIKKAYLNWSEKGVSYMDIMYAYDTMLAVDEALLRCEEILGEAGLGIGYTSKQSKMDRLLKGKCILLIYIAAQKGTGSTWHLPTEAWKTLRRYLQCSMKPCWQWQSIFKLCPKSSEKFSLT